MNKELKDIETLNGSPHEILWAHYPTDLTMGEHDFLAWCLKRHFIVPSKYQKWYMWN